MSNIIHLKDYSDIYNKNIEEYQFIKAYVTNSRLMGVVGVRLHFEGDKPLTLFFHLDYEEYGFDRFEAYEASDDESIERITQSFMGGLGAQLVEVSLKDASSLIYTAVDVGSKYYYDVPLEFFDYEYLLEDYCEPLTQDLCSKICCNINSDVEAIHYFLMRTAGLDYELRDFKFLENPVDFHFCDEPTVLLKNEIIAEEDTYVCRSIIDYYDAYKMIVTRIKMHGHKIESCTILNELVLTAKEASFQLNKKELIMICYSEEVEAFKLKLEKLKPSMLKNIYDGGTLYTEFQTHNRHVERSVFYLNGDVFGTFYVTDTNQIVISCFEVEALNAIKCELKENFEQVNILAELEAENPIVYNFVTSGSQDFFDYLGE